MPAHILLRFERIGQDLKISKKITLREALCGFSFPVKQLDGRVLLVKSKPGEIVKPGAVKAIPNEGMPQHRNPFNKGCSDFRRISSPQGPFVPL